MDITNLTDDVFAALRSTPEGAGITVNYAGELVVMGTLDGSIVVASITDDDAVSLVIGIDDAVTVPYPVAVSTIVNTFN